MHTHGEIAPEARQETPAFLARGGEMGRRIREFDWSATPLGEPARWPASLRMAVRLLLTTNHPVFVFWGADATCLYNDAYRNSLGPEKMDAMLGAPAREAWPETWHIIEPQIAQVMRGDGATWHENAPVPMLRNGRVDEVYWTYSYSPIDDGQAAGGIGGVLVLCTETTRSVLAERATAEAEARWRGLFEQAPGFMCTLRGPEHRFEAANPAYFRLVGRDDILGMTVLEAFPEFARQGFIALLDGVYHGGTPFTAAGVPLSTGLRSGSSPDAAPAPAAAPRYVDFVYQPIRDPCGSVVGVFVLGSDVTERVRASAALAQSESRYRALTERLPGGAVFVVDRDLRFVMAAGEALTDAKIAPQYFIGRSVGDVAEPSLAAHATALFRGALAGREFELEHADHGRFYLTRGAPLIDATGQVYAVLAASYDITARRQVETELRAANTRLEALMSAAEIGLWVWDLRNDTVEVDRNLRILYGFDRSGGGTRDQHVARIHPDDLPGVETAIAIALQTGTLYVREYRVRLPDGRVRWLAGRGTLQRDADGAPAVLTGLVIDIGDLKALEDSLKASDRRKDEFLAILAHELRNPLAPIRSAARILTTENLGAGELAWCRDVIQRQVQQMARLLDDLLDVSRITQRRLRLEKEIVDLATVVATAVETARPEIDARRHRLTLSLPPEPILVEVDPGRLSQVLSNLLNNAARYTEPGGEIALEAGRAGDDVRVTVRDTGVGMTAADLRGVFEMFTQVRSALDRSQGGLGIGLALVRGLVELHGGRVQADSAGPGRGSTFTVTLPCRRSSPVVAPEVANHTAPPLVGRRILVADDNRDAADSLAMLLELQGHETRVAYDGREALEVFAAFHPEIVLLDIGMPELNGYEVAERIRLAPGGRAVVLAALTGWGQQQDKRQAKSAGFDHHFAKPVDPDLLLATLQESAGAPTADAAAPPDLSC